ncbi:MAG: hypothetical protein QOF86_2431, partial [Baekduia sp.]|nr:hypothetical protein [Baekduia sp.]
MKGGLEVVREGSALPTRFHPTLTASVATHSRMTKDPPERVFLRKPSDG